VKQEENEMKQISGIHHITAIVGDAQENVNFYEGVLGLRLVKKTVNFDDPGTYHLYFGDEDGSPGTIMTFFPWPADYKGQIGTGQVGITSFAVPKGAFSYWEKRLSQFKIPFTKQVRFHEQTIQFSDPHGLKLELVEREQGYKRKWEISDIPIDYAIMGFAGAVLLSAAPLRTADLLENILGFKKIGEEDGYLRFRSSAEIGNTIDLSLKPVNRGYSGVGTVHHIALRAIDESDQLQWKQRLEENGFRVTPVQDRNYFKAIYFREEGGILFEIATDPPGFAIDEDFDKLGENLMLPEWLEPYREKIESTLKPIVVQSKKGNEK
jgi:glyoxalase family protein